MPRSRLTQVLLAFLALGVWGLLLRPIFPLGAARASSGVLSATFDTLTVQRINVVDPDGKLRFVIANSRRLPGAIERGHEYKQRSINDAAGMLFFDTNGNETGGLATAKDPITGAFAGMTLDYAYQPTDGIYVIRRESADGKHWKADFGISDRRPIQAGPITSSQGVPRVDLVDKDRDAALVISDAQGRPRIRIGVTADGKASIVMLTPDGKVAYNAGK